MGPVILRMQERTSLETGKRQGKECAKVKGAILQAHSVFLNTKPSKIILGTTKIMADNHHLTTKALASMITAKADSHRLITAPPPLRIPEDRRILATHCHPTIWASLPNSIPNPVMVTIRAILELAGCQHRKGLGMDNSTLMEEEACRIDTIQLVMI